MTFKSKRTITSMAAGAVLTATYIIYVFSSRAPTSGDISAWARLMLTFIGIAVGATIIIQIIFHIVYSIGIAVKERERSDKEVERIIISETAEDELDKLISLKSSRAGYACMGVGIPAVIIWFAFFGTSPIVALHILLGTITLGSFIEGCISVFLYERGFKNG